MGPQSASPNGNRGNQTGKTGAKIALGWVGVLIRMDSGTISDAIMNSILFAKCSSKSQIRAPKNKSWLYGTFNKGRHCCSSVGELKITFASTCNHGCKESVFNVLFNVLFLVLDFPLGAPNTLLKHVIEGSIWGIGWGGILVGLGIQFWWLGFWSCWYLSLTAVFGLTFRLLVLREYSYLGVYLSAVTLWSLPFVICFLLLMPRYALT